MISNAAIWRGRLALAGGVRIVHNRRVVALQQNGAGHRRIVGKSKDSTELVDAIGDREIISTEWTLGILQAGRLCHKSGGGGAA